MKRSLLIALSLLAVVVPIATARVVSLGESTKGFLPASPCPGKNMEGTDEDIPCVSPYQVTGYQDTAESTKEDPYLIRRSGKITAFTVKLGKVTSGEPTAQKEFFDGRFDAPAAVQISIVRPGKKRSRRNDHRVVAQSGIFPVDDYFGSSPTFVLDKPLNVKRGTIVALTIPTWAPVLATQQPRSEFWRSSRPKGKCGTSEKNAPNSVKERKDLSTWGCSYRGERLLYTASYVPENRTTKPLAPSEAATSRSRPRIEGTQARELGSLGGFPAPAR
jgi:hypothetical protein